MIDLQWWAEGCGGDPPLPFHRISKVAWGLDPLMQPFKRSRWRTPPQCNIGSPPMQPFAPPALDDPSRRDATSRGVIA